MVTRVVFLDMDGVLNSDCYFKAIGDKQIPIPEKEWNAAIDTDEWWTGMIDPVPVERLNRIIAATEAKVVISSSWRYHCTPEMMQRFLDTKGFKGEVIGRTPIVNQMPGGFQNTGKRGTEIEIWLVKNRHLNVMDYFAILDDIGPGGFPGLEAHHIHTSWGYGLLEEHVQPAIDLLSDA